MSLRRHGFDKNPYYVDTDDGSTDVAQASDVVKGSTTVRFFDNPLAVVNHTYTTFEVTVVMTNYMNSGKDIRIGSFTWGYNSHGATPSGGPTNNLQKQSSTSRTILKNDYNAYTFFDEQ